MVKKRYKNNFLTKVIFRIDFDKIELGKLREYIEAVSKNFPIVEEKQEQEGIINFDFKTKKVRQVSNSASAWTLYNKGKTKQISIHSRYLFIEYNEYKNSSELLKDIELISLFVKNYKIKTLKRVGLRYVNEINLKEKDFLNWKKYINNKLISSLDFGNKTNKRLARNMGQIVFKEDFGDVNFNFGLWNKNYPNEINEKIFILDFDTYSNLPVDAEEASLADLAKIYNKKTEELFETSIKEELRKKLNK